MTRFEAIDIDTDNDHYCGFCGYEADYTIDGRSNDEPFYICKKCLGVINQKVALIDGNEEI